MYLLLGLAAALAGVAAAAAGIRLWFRSRFRTGDLRRRALGRRLFGGGTALAALGPVISTAVAGPAGGEAVLVIVLALGWAGFVVLSGGAISLVMLLTRERVVNAARSSARRAVAKVPAPRVLTGRPASTNGLPRDWAELIELDRSLGRRLLSYHQVDAAAAHPVMADPNDPTTRAALQAMLACDTLRTPTPPRAWADVRATEYAAAVAEFRKALTAAEAHSTRVNQAAITDHERRAIEGTLRELSYVREHATTPGERAEVYQRLVRQLGELEVAETAGSGSPRSHPWLDVRQRAVSARGE